MGHALAEVHRTEQDYMEGQRPVSLFEAAEGPTVFLSHDVPHNTTLGEITDAASPKHGRHYGSGQPCPSQATCTMATGGRTSAGRPVSTQVSAPP